MRGSPVLLALVLMSSSVVAGCLAPQESKAADAWPADAAVASKLAAHPIDWDVEAAVDWWESFSRAFVKRDAHLPANDAARNYIVAELERIGANVEMRSYPACIRGVCGAPESVADMVAIVGTFPGDLVDADGRERRIGLVSHFDTVATTVEGAYDDASGVASSFHICEALAAVPLRHSVSCIFFDAEEQGLEASRAYVNDVVSQGDESFVFDYVIGYDMTGINWPGHDWKMYLMTGPDEEVPALAQLGRHVMHDVMDYPEDGVEVLLTHDRNSDERRFRDAGVPIYRFAGGRNAADYPQYHMPDDTVEYVYEFVDGRENFEAGFATIVEGSYALVLALDGTSIEDLHRRL